MSRYRGPIPPGMPPSAKDWSQEEWDQWWDANPDWKARYFPEPAAARPAPPMPSWSGNSLALPVPSTPSGIGLAGIGALVAQPAAGGSLRMAPRVEQPSAFDELDLQRAARERQQQDEDERKRQEQARYNAILGTMAPPAQRI